MKVISVRQPWASLIVNGYKKFEFRSWHTNFRGNVLIHASQNIEKKELKRFADFHLEYPTGVILGSVKITDCIKVEQEFEDSLLSKDCLVYGATKNRGGYAFQLEENKKLDMPIKAKGQLGFWDYHDEIEIMELMQEIDYGWIDWNNQKHFIIDSNYSSNYQLQSPKEIIVNKVGVCWDQVELERYYFKNNDWNVKTYFLCYYDDEFPTHTFLTYEKENKFYWFEHSWKKYKGIHSYCSQKELLSDIRKKFIITQLDNTYKEENLLLREYSKPNQHISMLEFYKHCEKNEPINFK